MSAPEPAESTPPNAPDRDAARLHLWALGTAASLLFAAHHAERTYRLYLAPGGGRLEGSLAAAVGCALGVVVARRASPFAERLTAWFLYVSAVAVGCASFVPFYAFDAGHLSRDLACACLTSATASTIAAAAVAYRATGRTAVALGVVPFVLGPFALPGALFVVLIVEFAMARAGFLASGAGVAALLSACAATYPDVYGFLHGPALPWPRAHRAARFVAALAVVGLLLVAERLVPRRERATFLDEIVFSTDGAVSRYAVVASPGGYELFSDGQLLVSSLDERRRTTALVAPVLSVAPRARRILLLYGGLGLVERALLSDAREPELTSVVPDARRLELSRSLLFLTARAEGALDRRRLREVIAEPLVWLSAKHTERFDVIVADFPLPLGYGEGSLYTHYALSRVAALLGEDGVMVVPGGSAYASREVLAGVIATLESVGVRAAAYHAAVPTIGVASFVVGSHAPLPPGALQRWQSADLGKDLTPTVPGRVSTLYAEYIVTAFDR